MTAALPTLVIGDIHGHTERLWALLHSQQLLVPCPNCAYGCPACADSGWVRETPRRARVVQLGDIGHWGENPAAPDNDIRCLQIAASWCDTLLWGNHDRAVVSQSHQFTGFHAPPTAAYHILHSLRNSGQLQLATSAHGWLLTHAGLSAAWKHTPVPDTVIKDDPQAIADWLNEEDAHWFDVAPTGAAADVEAERKQYAMNMHPSAMATRDAVSSHRGGGGRHGGILWRDYNENLYRGFPQVYGHSADHKHHCIRRDGVAHNATIGTVSGCYDIDVGGVDWLLHARCAAGIWLPDEQLIKVTLPDFAAETDTAIQAGTLAPPLPALMCRQPQAVADYQLLTDDSIVRGM